MDAIRKVEAAKKEGKMEAKIQYVAVAIMDLKGSCVCIIVEEEETIKKLLDIVICRWIKIQRYEIKTRLPIDAVPVCSKIRG